MRSGAWGLCGFLVFLSQNALACEPSYFRVVKVPHNDVLNIREGPSTEHRIIGIIAPEGRDVENTCSCNEEWCQIRYFGVVGWVNRAYLAPDRR